MKTNFKTAALVQRPAKPAFSSSGAIPTGCTVLCALLLVFSARGNTLTWSGGAVPNANWNDSANWGGVGIPGNGDTIIFSGSHTNAFVNTNNIANLSLNQIQFVGDNTFGVMFDLRGNPFTLTGSILATNATGTNIIENNLTLPNASELIVVSNSDQLIIEGVLSGAGGVTKAGAGTLTYQCAGDNTYTNTTLVNGGTLQFNVSGADAVSGPLVIGDGSVTHAAVVEDLQSREMDNLPSVTINSHGELNLNGFNEPFFTTNLMFNNGALATSGGILTLSPTATITSTNTPYVYGSINLNGGTLTLQGSDDMNWEANLGGAGNILQTGNLGINWGGANTYTGNYTANGSGFVQLFNSQALGSSTSTLTLNGTATVFMGQNLDVTNQSLTVNSTASPAIVNYDLATNSWQSSFIFNTPCAIDVGTNGALALNGSISGAASVTKTDFGQLVLGGTTANTYTGATTVELGLLLLNKAEGVPAVPGNLVIDNGATVRLENSQQTVNTTDVSLDNTTALFDLATFSTDINRLSGDGTVNFGTGGWIAIGENNGYSTFNGSFTGTGYAPGFTVGKLGTGTITLGGNSSYTAGITHVYQGELVVNGYQAAIPVTVDAGAALDGSGYVGEVKANGTVEPGAFGQNTGTLFSGDVTFSSTGNFAVQLTGTDDLGYSSSDQLYAIGPVGTNFLGNATLTIVPYFPTVPAVGQQFVILNGQGTGLPLISDVISGTFKNLPNGAGLNVDGIGFQISYSTYQVVLTVTNSPPRPVITAIQPVRGGGFQLTGVGVTNVSYSVWANTNLATTNWIYIGYAPVPTTTNVFQFTDTNTMYYADRFYRFTWP